MVYVDFSLGRVVIDGRDDSSIFWPKAKGRCKCGEEKYCTEIEKKDIVAFVNESKFSDEIFFEKFHEYIATYDVCSEDCQKKDLSSIVEFDPEDFPVPVPGEDEEDLMEKVTADAVPWYEFQRDDFEDCDVSKYKYYTP